jgi:hypothetical protein
MNIDELITGFNSEDKPTINKIKVLFRSIPIFVKYLIKMGRVTDIDLGSLASNMFNSGDGEFRGDVYNEILKSTGPDYFLKYFRYITKEKDGYYASGSWTFVNTLSSLMTDYEKSKAIEEALGSDWVEMFEIYSDNIDYFYDIVKNLNNTNKKYLKERILYYCGTDKYHWSDFNWPDPYEEFFNEQGYFSVYENIDEIMRYDGLFDMVIDLKVLDDFKTQLTHLYSTAYNESWGDQMKDIIMEAFSGYFDFDTLIVDENEHFKIKIVGFEKILSKYFECGAIDGLHITYDEILYSLFYDSGCLEPPSIKILSSPQPSKVNEFLNEYFVDNIG